MVYVIHLWVEIRVDILELSRLVNGERVWKHVGIKTQSNYNHYFNCKFYTLICKYISICNIHSLMCKIHTLVSNL